MIPLVTGTYIGRKKTKKEEENTDFRNEDHLWMKREEGGDPASPINSETASNDQMEEGELKMFPLSSGVQTVP